MVNIRHQEVLNKVVKYLQEIAPKSVSKEDCAAAIAEPPTSTYRALKACDTAGLLVVDRSRSPWIYGWKKGAIPNVAPTFPYWNDHIKETTVVRDAFNRYVSEFTENTGPTRNNPTLLILDALASMDSDDQEEIADRNKWLSEAVAALYPFYNAYRLIKVIEQTTDKKRLSKSQGFNFKCPNEMDIRDLLRTDRNRHLQRIQDFLANIRRVPKAAPVVELASDPEPAPATEPYIAPEPTPPKELTKDEEVERLNRIYNTPPETIWPED